MTGQRPSTFFDEMRGSREGHSPRDFLARTTLGIDRAAIALLRSLDEKSSVDVIELESAIVDLTAKVSSAARGSTSRPPGSLRRRALADAIEFMHAHFAEPIDLSAIAKAASSSLYHFARGFCAMTGTPPHRYLRALRLNRGRELLHARGCQISVIAHTCGFASQASFTATFANHFGITPARYRRLVS